MCTIFNFVIIVYYSDDDSIGIHENRRLEEPFASSSTKVSVFGITVNIMRQPYLSPAVFCTQSRKAGPTITTSTAAGVLSSDCLRYGVPVQEELCTQRPCWMTTLLVR